MKGSMKKLFAVMLALSLIVTGLGLDSVLGNKGANEVQAAATDGYKKLGFTHYGYVTRTQLTNPSYGTILGTAHTETEPKVEFEGIISLQKNQDSRIYFGGTGSHAKAVELHVESGGNATLKWKDRAVQYINNENVEGAIMTEALQGKDIILNIKMDITSATTTTSDVTTTVSLTNRETMKTFYSYTIEKTGETTADFAPDLRIYVPNGSIYVEPMDWEFDPMGFEDYGYTKRTNVALTGITTMGGTASTEALTNVEFEGIIHVPTSQKAYIWFGGTSRMDGASLQIEADGKAKVTWAVNGIDDVKQYINQSNGPTVALQGKDLILNMRLVPKKMSDTTSDVLVGITLTDRITLKTIYTFSYTKSGVTTAVLSPNLFMWNQTGGMTIEPVDGELEYDKMGFWDYGYAARTNVAITQLNQPMGGTASTEALTNVEFEGIINVPTNQKAYIWFGGTSRMDGACLQIYEDGTFKVSWATGGSDDFRDSVNNTVILQGKNLILNIKLAPIKMSDTTSDVLVAFTLTDRTTLETVYTFSFTKSGVTTSKLAPNLFIWTPSGNMTIEPMDGELGYDQMGFLGYGYAERTELALTGITTMGGTASTEALTNVEFEGIINVPTNQKAYIWFGGTSRMDGACLNIGEDGKSFVSWATNGNDSVKQYINQSNGPTVTLQGTDLILNMKLALKEVSDTTSNVFVEITLTDRTTQDTVYTFSYTQSGVTTSVLAPNLFIWTPSGSMTIEPVEDGAVLTVGGEGTYTDAFDVIVEQGERLPVGYTTDGKYILGWTADGDEVTVYDKVKANYEAKYVDTKMLSVKQQNDGKTPKDVRFIGSLNTLNGYDEAGFVFANQQVNGELTIDNGARVKLNIAYSALNAAGESVTADQIYDEYSNYFFAYAIREIPAGATIYARAYVILDGTVIYGDMTTFAIDQLN